MLFLEQCRGSVYVERFPAEHYYASGISSAHQCHGTKLRVSALPALFTNRWDHFLKVPEPLKHAGSSTMSLLSYISHHGRVSRRQSAHGASTESSLASPVSHMRPGITATPTAAGVAGMRQPHGSPATALSRLGNAGAAVTVLGSQHVITMALSQGGGVAPMSATPGGPWQRHGYHSSLGREGRDSQHLEGGFSLALGAAQQCLLPLTGQLAFDASLPALSQVTKVRVPLVLAWL